MKNNIFLIMFLTFGVMLNANAQVNNDNVVKDSVGATSSTDPVFSFTEESPQFPGGMDAMMSFINGEIRYPEEAREKGITGTMLVEFVVEKDGSVSNVKVKVPLFPECDNEAIRVITAMPRWKPGKNNGEPVRCFYQVPIMFRP